MRAIRVSALCLLLVAATAIAGRAQQFEVASIRSMPDGSVPAGSQIGVRVTGSQVRLSGLSLKDYIGMAFAVDPPQVIAPEWTGQQRFEIAANLPADGAREQIPQMLQALLAERFQLKVHRESRELPVYALTVGKGGLKIKGTPVDPNAPLPPATEVGGSGSNAGAAISLGAGSFTLIDNKLEVRQLTMADLALALTRFSERKTLDATGLTDRFDFSLELSPEDFQFVRMRAAVNNGYVLPPQALRYLDTAPPNVLGQYIGRTGLALEERRAPLEVLVVDSVAKAPTEN